MGKIYLSCFVIFLSIPAFTQQLPVDRGVPVHAGDAFSIHANIVPVNHRRVLANSLKLLGAAATTYSAVHAAPTNSKPGAEGSRSIALPLLGVGAIVSADKIFGTAKEKLFLSYYLFDKTGNFITSGSLRVYKKGQPLTLSGKATSDGFLKVSLADSKGRELDPAVIGLDIIPRSEEADHSAPDHSAVDHSAADHSEPADRGPTPGPSPLRANPATLTLAPVSNTPFISLSVHPSIPLLPPHPAMQKSFPRFAPINLKPSIRSFLPSKIGAQSARILVTHRAPTKDAALPTTGIPAKRPFVPRPPFDFINEVPWKEDPEERMITPDCDGDDWDDDDDFSDPDDLDDDGDGETIDDGEDDGGGGDEDDSSDEPTEEDLDDEELESPDDPDNPGGGGFTPYALLYDAEGDYEDGIWTDFINAWVIADPQNEYYVDANGTQHYMEVNIVSPTYTYTGLGTPELTVTWTISITEIYITTSPSGRVTTKPVYKTRTNTKTFFAPPF